MNADGISECHVNMDHVVLNANVKERARVSNATRFKAVARFALSSLFSLLGITLVSS